MQDIIWELEEDGKHDEQSEKFERKNAVVKIPAKEKAAELFSSLSRLYRYHLNTSETV